MVAPPRMIFDVAVEFDHPNVIATRSLCTRVSLGVKQQPVSCDLWNRVNVRTSCSRDQSHYPSKLVAAVPNSFVAQCRVAPVHVLEAPGGGYRDKAYHKTSHP